LRFEKKPQKELLGVRPEEQEDQVDILNAPFLSMNYLAAKLLIFMGEEMIYYSLTTKTKEFNI